MALQYNLSKVYEISENDIDFALQIQNTELLSSKEAIHKASVLRFRPIIMTSCAALLGALPMAFGSGVGSEIRKPLGIAIVGGLVVSQILTLYTTPVIYLFFERFLPYSQWILKRKQKFAQNKRGSVNEV